MCKNGENPAASAAAKIKTPRKVDRGRCVHPSMYVRTCTKTHAPAPAAGAPSSGWPCAHGLGTRETAAPSARPPARGSRRPVVWLSIDRPVGVVGLWPLAFFRLYESSLSSVLSWPSSRIIRTRTHRPPPLEPSCVNKVGPQRITEVQDLLCVWDVINFRNRPHWESRTKEANEMNRGRKRTLLPVQPLISESFSMLPFAYILPRSSSCTCVQLQSDVVVSVACMV